MKMEDYIDFKDVEQFGKGWSKRAKLEFKAAGVFLFSSTIVSFFGIESVYIGVFLLGAGVWAFFETWIRNRLGDEE